MKIRRLLVVMVALISPFTLGASVASFPQDLNEWVLVKESVIPGKDVILPEGTSLFIQETVKTYNWINGGNGTKLDIYVPKNKVEAFRKHGPYEDGPTAVGIYEDSDIVFVTEHIGGEVIYGTYDSKGNDISDTHPTFKVEICVNCHEANKDICRNGTCATPIIDIFK